MPTEWSFPTPEELGELPVVRIAQLARYLEEREKAGEKPPRALMDLKDIGSFLQSAVGFRPAPKLIREMSSPEAGIMPPPVHRNGKGPLFVYPDHFDLLAVALSLKRRYGLALEAIRKVLQNLPRNVYSLIVDGKLLPGELDSFVKMTSKGFGVRDFLMAKFCDEVADDVLREVTISSDEPWDRLWELQDESIRSRLKEMQAWVDSGRRKEYMKAEFGEVKRRLPEIRARALKQLQVLRIEGHG